MKNNLFKLTIPVALASSLFAADTHVELSYVQTGGNSDTTTFAAKAKTKQVIDDRSWVKAKLDAMYGSSNGVNSSNKYEIDANYNRTIDAKLYYYMDVNYKEDKFSGFDYKVTVGPGIGYEVLKDEIKTLDIKVGVNYAKDVLDNGDSTDYASANTEAEYTHKISDTVNFTQLLKYAVSMDDTENYTATSETGVAVKMSDKMSLGVSYKYDYANIIAVGKDHADTKFLTSLIIDF